MTGPSRTCGIGRTGVARIPNGALPPPLLPATTPASRTLSSPMWMRSLVRKVLELKEDEPKAFFIKASARQKQHGAGCSLHKRQAMGRRACGNTPQAGSCLRPSSGGKQRTWDLNTGITLKGQLAPGEGLDQPAVTRWPFPVLASQVKWAQGPCTAGVEISEMDHPWGRFQPCCRGEGE